MNLYEFYDRVVETTGLDVMTIGSLRAAIKNCMADLTSRGYKEFKELSNDDFELVSSDDGIVVYKLPNDIRKTLYLKCAFNDQTIKATRLSVTDPRIEAVFNGSRFESVLKTKECIYYIKKDNKLNCDCIHIEWDYRNLKDLKKFIFGYYSRLSLVNIPDDIDISYESLSNYKIDIREEFEDALVLYATYFYFVRYIKDLDKAQLHLNNYKFYVEDIIHELSYEDNFYEEDSVIKVE